MIKEELKLVQEWDKTFGKSDKVDHMQFFSFMVRKHIPVIFQRMPMLR